MHIISYSGSYFFASYLGWWRLRTNLIGTRLYDVSMLLDRTLRKFHALGITTFFRRLHHLRLYHTDGLYEGVEIRVIANANLHLSRLL